MFCKLFPPQLKQVEQRNQEFKGTNGYKEKSVKTSEIEKTMKSKLENVIKRLVDMQKSMSDLRKELKKNFNITQALWSLSNENN